MSGMKQTLQEKSAVSNSDSNHLKTNPITINDNNFPLLGKHCKCPTTDINKVKESSTQALSVGGFMENPTKAASSISKQVVTIDRFRVNPLDSNVHARKSCKLSFGDFIKDPVKVVSITPKQIKVVPTVKYGGNPLDSDLPIRKSGKFREIPKPKKFTKLKREIIQNKEEVIEVLQNEEVHSIELKNIFGKNVITEDFNEAVASFISRIVDLQEKLFKRDCIKGKSKRRYVVGLHEAKKYLNLNKAKIIIIATDIHLFKDAIQSEIQEIADLCTNNNVYYLFALKRRKIGALTLKHIPVSCITILNYEGAEEQFQLIKGEVQNTISEDDGSSENGVVNKSNDINDMLQNKVIELLGSKKINI